MTTARTFLGSFHFRFLRLLIPLCMIRYAEAQKIINITDSLAIHADKMEVKNGSNRNSTITRFHFGDYAVTSTESGWVKPGHSETQFNKKVEGQILERFSFVLTDTRTGAYATINVANNFDAEQVPEIEMFPDFPLKNDALWPTPQDFAAFIRLSSDTSETWTMIALEMKSLRIDGGYDALITHDNRKILLYPAYSNWDETSRHSVPAMGYELFENCHSLGALQYYGGTFGNKNIIWINRQLENNMKLMLAAAMTALLHKKDKHTEFWYLN